MENPAKMSLEENTSERENDGKNKVKKDHVTNMRRKLRSRNSKKKVEKKKTTISDKRRNKSVTKNQLRHKKYARPTYPN